MTGEESHTSTHTREPAPTAPPQARSPGSILPTLHLIRRQFSTPGLSPDVPLQASTRYIITWVVYEGSL